MRPPREPRDLDPELSRPGLQLNRVQGILARYAVRDHPGRSDGVVPIAAVCAGHRTRGADSDRPARVIFATLEHAQRAAAALARIAGLHMRPVACDANPRIRGQQLPAEHFHLQSRRALPLEPRDPNWQPRIHTPPRTPHPVRSPVRPAAPPAPLTTPRSSTR
jgi:hypothetical protein